MSEHRGLGDREGAELLAHVAQYVPSLRPQAAAGLLGAFTDDPHLFEDQLERFVRHDTLPPTAR